MRPSLPVTSLFLALGCAAPAMPPDAPRLHDAPVRCVGGVEVARIEGRALDELGAPVAEGRAQLCARVAPDDHLVCLVPPITDAIGAFVIDVDPSIRCLSAATLRVIVPRGGFATTYCPVDLTPTSAGQLDLTAPLVVTRVPAATALPALGDVSEVREVDLGAALLRLAPSALASPEDYARLGARSVAASTSCIPAMRAMDGIVLFSPESELTQPATLRLRIPEATAGQRFELHVLGGIGTTLADGSAVDEGEVALLEVTQVQEDGTVALSTPLRYLSQLGWRRMP